MICERSRLDLEGITEAAWLANVKCRNAEAGGCVKLRLPMDSVKRTCDLGGLPIQAFQPATRGRAASCSDNVGAGAQPAQNLIATPSWRRWPGAQVGEAPIKVACRRVLQH